eukprot:TRINITY_DN14311_c0_g1_i7.p1 TRINITY_DN14311_c0_g1~~TRINITY_DN14311_c0_g1_i7.p1  ORF type:complete len:214 (-),score=66.31 TRINITY_DN14311_c0_g1_i7:359-970(-)
MAKEQQGRQQTVKNASTNSNSAIGTPSTSRDRRLSESNNGNAGNAAHDFGAKTSAMTSRRTSWKQVDLASGMTHQQLQEASIAATATPAKPSNPWKTVTDPSPTSPSLSLSPLKKGGGMGCDSFLVDDMDKSFQEIMELDVKEEKTLQQNKTKPIHLVQLEEQAMMELQQLYSLQYPDEVITVSRVASGPAAKPVWNYKTLMR